MAHKGGDHVAGGPAFRLGALFGQGRRSLIGATNGRARDAQLNQRPFGPLGLGGADHDRNPIAVGGEHIQGQLLQPPAHRQLLTKPRLNHDPAGGRQMIDQTAILGLVSGVQVQQVGQIVVQPQQPTMGIDQAQAARRLAQQIQQDGRTLHLGRQVQRRQVQMATQGRLDQIGFGHMGTVALGRQDDPARLGDVALHPVPHEGRR